MRKTWIALAIAHGIALFWLFHNGFWLLTKSGTPMIHDFLDLWAAGVRAWNGEALLAYDAKLHIAFQGSLVGAGPQALPFPYPPHFLFFMLPFAALPYFPAMIAFLIISAILYILALRLIVKDIMTAIAMGLAIGGGLLSFLWGQIGFLTAALLVGGLALLPKYPVLAGILFGCLTFKPHLGPALALGLLLGKQWKAIGVALTTTLILGLSAELVFGPGVWEAFLSAAQNQMGLLQSGSIKFKGQSVFALTYPWLGFKTAMLIHALSACLAIWVLAWTFFSQPRHEVRAAAIIATTLLISPYLYAYDAIILTGAAAFLLKDSKLALEKILIVIACVLPGASKLVPGAAVPAAAWLMLYLAARHGSRPNRSGPERRFAGHQR